MHSLGACLEEHLEEEHLGRKPQQKCLFLSFPLTYSYDHYIKTSPDLLLHAQLLLLPILTAAHFQQ